MEAFADWCRVAQLRDWRHDQVEHFLCVDSQHRGVWSFDV
jgi:hypothetical protein